MLTRRHILAAGIAGLATPRLARAQELPGVTATELRIGNTMPYSGPASAYGVIGRSHQHFFRMINDQGGVAGRKINFITYDDNYSPPKTVEQVRRLVEQDKVAFLFNPLGTATNSAIQRYVNQRKVPHIFLSTGADKWAEPKQYPWTIGWQPSYRTEAQIYAKHILAQKPGAKIGLLYQNDDFGKDYLIGLKDIFGANFDSMVKQVSYEVTDPTIDSQVVSLQSAGVEVLVTAATPKFAAQTIKKVFDLGWKPVHYLTNVSISVGAVMEPAGMERGIGIITSAYLKDETDPAWAQDAGMKEWRGFMAKYIPDGDLKDAGYTFGYSVAQTVMQVLKQCEGDFSRENIMRQATSLKSFAPATVLPGITVNTTATNYHPIKQLQLARWTGKTWERFGGLIEGADV
ncbi:ABC transporter substrate-binding protein [Roseicella sp. DB1501]|uniref:ABC transporter substrate-binding protein n=1 Tax=Roseicella sp. DB1501 TaxID=2730925 RepID=UPI0014919789|nr:ABC transporter substrate-binding protein [Roseicella sp. DB1501]NOG70710.1 ABC transporter substrate-binding protein [Roseicella sp. DB1501]